MEGALTEPLEAYQGRRPPSFDPYLAPSGPLKTLIDEVARLALNVEAHNGLRRRARRPRDLQIFHETIAALITNAIYVHLLDLGSFRVTLDRSKLARKSRYTNVLLSEQLPKLLELLGRHMAFVEVVKGFQSPFENASRQTEVSAAAWLVNRISSMGITLGHIDRREGEEIVLLKGEKTGRARADLKEYDDTALTNRYRSEMQLINHRLKVADIFYDGPENVDYGARHLKRVFTRGTFRTGGRLFGLNGGGFWLNLRKNHRLRHLLIDGEPVVSIDFASMLAALAYAHVGLPLPDGDAYQIPCVARSGARVRMARGTLKSLFAASLNASKPLAQWPEDLRAHSRGLPVSAVLAAIERAHPAIAELFGRDLGQTFAFTESSILVEVLLRLGEQGVTALPVHDCILVADSAEAVASQLMLAAFRFQTGQPGRIAIERAPQA